MQIAAMLMYDWEKLRVTSVVNFSTVEGETNFSNLSFKLFEKTSMASSEAFLAVVNSVHADKTDERLDIAALYFCGIISSLLLLVSVFFFFLFRIKPVHDLSNSTVQNSG